MAPHSSTLAWKIPWTEEPGVYLTVKSKKKSKAAILEKSHSSVYICIFVCWGYWWAAVHGIAKSWTQLSDFTFTFHFHALEKEMATDSSVLAWRIPGTGSLVGCHLWGHTESDTTEAT